MRRWQVLLFAIIGSVLYVPVLSAAASCFCKAGPLSKPVRDFGRIARYRSQIGNTADCRQKCATRAKEYFKVAANLSDACAATGGGAFSAYSAVGTRPYKVAASFSCPPTKVEPLGGSINFGMPTGAVRRRIRVNGEDVEASCSSPVKFVKDGDFTTFVMDDYLQYHIQSWTYTAKLFRDGVLVDQLSRKSPPVFNGTVLVVFTSQPNSIVRGHRWTVEWRYAGPRFTNGSCSFYIL